MDQESDNLPESQSLAEALDRAEISVETEKLLQMQKYCRLLWQKNRVMNLTRHTDFDTFVGRDVLDAWKLSSCIPANQEVMDIGTGGGVPGVLLAILRPDLQVACVDSVGKKAAAVEEFVKQLELPVEVYHNRAEEILIDFRYDFCVARAVGPLWKICEWLSECWFNVGHLLAMKGPRFQMELAEAREKNLLNDLDVQVVSRYPLRGTESESIIVDICLKSRRESENSANKDS